MELGLGFDDSDFAEAPKEKKILTSYNAKVCTPKWFITAEGTDGHEDPATSFKFKGDYLYRLGDYRSAIHAFNDSLGAIGSQNRTMRREVYESLSRSYLKLGDLNTAQEFSYKMMRDCLTEDQKCQAMILQQQIYRQGWMITEEIQMLHKLIFLHPFNSTFWLSLAQAYKRVDEVRLDASRHPKHMNPSMAEICAPTSCPQIICRDCESSLSRNNAGNQGTGSDISDAPLLASNACTRLKGTGDHKNIDVMKIDGHDICESFDKAGGHNIQEPKWQNEGKEKVSKVDESLGTIWQETNGQAQQHNSQEQVTDVGEKTVDKTGEIDVLDEVEKCDRLPDGLSPRLMQLTCYVRVRLILDSVQDTQGTFVKDRNIQLSQQVREEIESLTDDERTLHAVTMFMEKDMFTDTSYQRDEAEEEPNVTTEDKNTADDFNNRWFSWIRMQ